MMNEKPKVAIVMGSSSDSEIMRAAAEVLKKFDIEFDFNVVSAHRSPGWMYEYAGSLDERGIKIVIAGAGGAAHLPGMMAALTTVPVIGVPVKSQKSMDGWDSMLSIVQMPDDIPVATVALNGAHNAGLLAVQMLAIGDESLKRKLEALKKANYDKVMTQNEGLQKPW